MTRRSIRDNAFLLAAVLLPVVVIGLFLLFTAIPRWTVPAPQYDVLLQTTDYDSSGRRMSVELFVRDERLHASVRAPGQNMSPPRVRLWRFDHLTMNLQEVPLDLPDEAPGAETSRPIVVDAMRERRIITDTRAPDGYEVRTQTQRGPGLIGDIFGMRRYEQAIILANRGRMVAIKAPTASVYQTPTFVGWLIDGGR